MNNFGPPGYGGGHGDPFADPFGPSAPMGSPAGDFIPPPRPPLVPAPVQRATSVAGGWSVMSVATGVVAVGLALTPFYTDIPSWVGFIGAAIGIGALAAGILALRRVRRAGAQPPVPAVTGVVAAGLVAVLVVVSVLIDVNQPDRRRDSVAHGPVSGETKDTAVVMHDQLDVSFGTFDYKVDGPTIRGRLPVTFRNKLDKPRQYDVSVAGFEGEHTQVCSTLKLEPGALDAHATTTVDYFDIGIPNATIADRLRSSTFRVVQAWSRPV
ncbi:hypothetical protein A5784_15115 [Mycobacterium sp. 852013-50091_SCH5140682]|uniref:hypothetical protein n=1 Tax=Mycobacterium sp. 852013-50091_SCH5140682 TaxID=1834109 RepID=UPI0007EB9F55|nr:hypothetical protein [Mycobacterium sp. 852013-50091_SCH5140682]OBC03230.1 hypothetical protein A5784_15115 [Mycobacterium sp. 852013-50091_SCH5140682]